MVTNLRLPGQYDERLFAAAGISGMQGPYYNWNRWYLPSMGRYMELDPIALAGGFNGLYGPNWYGYAEANPMTWVDPSGQVPWLNPYLGGDPATQLGPIIGFIGSRQLPSVSSSWKMGIVWEFSNNKLQDMIGGYSTTYAHAICHSTANTGAASVQQHELQHVMQSNYLGPFYLPAHIAAQLYSYVTTGTYEQNNPFEWGPYSNPPVPLAPRPRP